MTLTVRLDTAIESALDRYCSERGVTRSLVVQESLAAYLLGEVSSRANAAAGIRAITDPATSATFKAFADAGLIGAVALGAGADKQAVRARMAESFAQRKARRSGA